MDSNRNRNRKCRTKKSALLLNHVFANGTTTTTTTTSDGMTTICSIRKETMVTVTKTSTSSPQVEVTKQTQTQTPNEASSSSSSLSSIQDNNSVTITPSAIQQIHHLAKQRNPDNPSAVFLRVYVDAGGCSGFQYKFELEQIDETDGDGDGDGEPAIDPDEDVVIQSSLSDGSLSDITVVIDEGSLEYIKGSTVDFVREMIRSSFAIVANPLSESACGCGSSFALKNFEANPALD